MESNKSLFLVFSGVAILIIGFVVWGMIDSSTSREGGEITETLDPSEVVYYYGETCPHCKDVKKFFDENDVRNKISFSEKEVWNNRENAKEMSARAEVCGLDPNSIGVPFLYAKGKCYIGTPDVTRWFAERIQN